MDFIAGKSVHHYLALDQSPRVMGWALGNADMQAPLSGAVKLPNESGIMLKFVRDWLSTNIKVYHVDKLAYEEPFLVKNAYTYAAQHQLIGVILLACADAEIPAVMIPVNTWRKRFLGFGRGGRDWLKKQAILACAQRKWPVKTHDEADACGILDYLLASDFPHYGTTIGTSLFN